MINDGGVDVAKSEMGTVSVIMAFCKVSGGFPIKMSVSSRAESGIVPSKYLDLLYCCSHGPRLAVHACC